MHIWLHEHFAQGQKRPFVVLRAQASTAGGLGSGRNPMREVLRLAYFEQTKKNSQGRRVVARCMFVIRGR